MRAKDKIALTPPMGWNSWDCYAATVNEEQLLGNAAYMAEHLKQYGWEYIVCDIQWSEPLAGTGDSEYRPFARLTLDEFGRQFPAPNRFPSSAGGAGFAPIAEKIHAMGLKFGIHIMRGIPKQAVYERLPVYGTSFTAADVANPFSICRWNSDMFGLNIKSAGAQAYYDSIFKLYAEWGVDFVKVDDICNTNMYPHDPYSAEGEVEMIRRAIDNCGRQMVLSLSPGPAIVEKAWHLERNANMWRITDDFWDRWDLLLAMFERCEVWQRHVAPGCWPDCDMLPLGHIGMGFKKDRKTNFTHDEQRTMMTLWNIFRSPLMMGGELRDNDEWTLSLLTNDEVLRLNKHSYGAFQIARNETHAIWGSHDEDGSFYLALFNLSDERREVSCPLEEFSLDEVQVRDLWLHLDLGLSRGQVNATLPPHGSVLYRLTRVNP